jgi:hypothetical protein
MPGAGVVHHIIRDRVEPATSPAMSAMPPMATRICSARKCRDGPFPDSCIAAKQTFAVGTRVTSRPPHRAVQAAFPHTACMGLSLSRRHHAISVVLCHSILLFDLRRKHSFVPTAYLHRRRAQRRSRTALLQRRRRLVLDRREHGGRLPSNRMVGPRDDPRGACHWPRSIARTTLVFG